LAPLTSRADLTSVAETWASHMAATDTLRHNPALMRFVHNWQAVGENVGDGPTIGDLDAAFMASPSHRANVLDPSYNDVGVGTAVRDGVIWISVVFRDPYGATQRGIGTRDGALPRAGTMRVAHGYPVVSLGSTGSLVALVQRRLGLANDGIFGPITRRAVQSFQRRHALVVDGIVGPRTWAALRTRVEAVADETVPRSGPAL